MDFPYPIRSSPLRADAAIPIVGQDNAWLPRLIGAFHLLGWGGHGPEPFGIRPRNSLGCQASVAPLMHGSFAHSSPTRHRARVGHGMLFLYPHGGIAACRDLFGAGVIVGWRPRFVTLFASGLGSMVRQPYLSWPACWTGRGGRLPPRFVVAFMYGYWRWGCLPVPLGVSWETHSGRCAGSAPRGIAWRHLMWPR